MKPSFGIIVRWMCAAAEGAPCSRYNRLLKKSAALLDSWERSDPTGYAVAKFFGG